MTPSDSNAQCITRLEITAAYDVIFCDGSRKPKQKMQVFQTAIDQHPRLCLPILCFC